MSKRGIIFDLDGTLWDVTDTAVYSANEISKKHGLPPVDSDTVKRAFGQPREGSAKIYFPYLPPQEALPLIDEIIAFSSLSIPKTGGYLYPGLTETLTALYKDYGLFIVSNSPQNGYIKSFIDFSNTGEFFENYYAAGAYSLTKAQAIKKAVADNGLDRAIYVGDTEGDCLAASGAGVEFVYAKYGFGEVAKAKHIINSLAELPDIAAKIFNC